MRYKKVKVCRWCGAFNDIKATRCNNWAEICIGPTYWTPSDFYVIEVDLNEETISRTKLGNQSVEAKTEDNYMNRDGMSPRERWLQRFKKEE